MKKLASTLLLLCYLPALFATTWSWSSPYPNVTHFRYQLNSEEEGGWTVVSKETTSFSSAHYTSSDVLFVQQSLDDGLSWSPSGKARAVEEEKPKQGFNLGFSLVPYHETIINNAQNLVYPNDHAVGLNIELALNDMLNINNLGLGIYLDIGASFIPRDEFSLAWLGKLFSQSDTLPRYYFDLMARSSYSLQRLDFNAALGGGVAIVMSKGVGKLETGSGSLVPALSLAFGFDYHLSEALYLGLETKYHYDIEAKVSRLASSLKIGVDL